MKTTGQKHNHLPDIGVGNTNKTTTMKKAELSQTEIDYIKENRLNMSMNQMSANLKVSFYKVSNYMKKNNLMVDKETVQEIRTKNYVIGKKAKIYDKKEDWIFDFWNKNINPITMFRA